ncbi:MAG: hypothetical protein QOE84_2082 [Actinomycetota bacterium]|nr:hypothetical protein [Actinomycetota bacterium]
MNPRFETSEIPMSGSTRAGRRRTRRRGRQHRGFVSVAVLVAGALTLLGVVALPSSAALGTVGSGFTVTSGDLAFILRQIKIAEQHAATLTPANPCGTLVGPGVNQVPDNLTPYGLRTVDGSCNNLFPGRETFAAADVPFPRLTAPDFRTAEPITAALPVGAPGPTSYAQKTGNVVDSQPRVISNLVDDQTSTNPAAVFAAGNPVRTQGNPGLVPCTTDPVTTTATPTAGIPVGCVPSHKTLFIPNVTTDVGLSPPYNSLFTFFGQFFDHGVDQTVKGGAAVFVPLKADDPLITVGPDGIPNTGDEVPPSQAFMVLTRAQNQPGPDGILGNADDVQNANNTDTPWVDNSQTYTSHASHQVFIREYVNNTAGRPVSTGKLLGGLPANAIYPGSPDGTTGIGTWFNVKRQAATLLGLHLVDRDVTNIPMIAADPYGKFIPGPARGLPQYVTTTGLVEGNLAGGGVLVPANARHFDTPFLTDIAHNADPSPQSGPGTCNCSPVPDTDTVASADFAHQPPGTYDDEMLNMHFSCGDGRCNENIALSTIHQIFHSEHDRLVADIKNTLTNDTSATGVAALADWKLAAGAAGWNGERLFQAARYVNEMEYQHLVFEEFARKMQPAVRPFHVYSPDINSAIPAEFAHAVYRFGHSMLDDSVARTNVDPVTGAKSDNSIPLLTAFLNPPEYFNGNAAGVLTPERAAGSVVMGSSDQVGNELDEFVVETLRNNLLGLPLDLPTLNITRAREAGVQRLNPFRAKLFGATNDGQLKPYTSWADYGQHLKHPQSLVNFVAAYGQYPTITAATTLVAKRAAATAIVDPPIGVSPTADQMAFLNSTGAWANVNGASITGLDDVDLWDGGLAEVTNLFGGLLGSTFNYVFQNTLENLQDGDRLYYLNRTQGLNLRTQLEGNSFSELIQRNTVGTSSLKADAFATADCRFELANINGPAAVSTLPRPVGYPAQILGVGSVNDDPSTTDCDENLLLLQKPDGTIQYRAVNAVNPVGINGQSVYNGTAGVDRIWGGNDNDTIWGGPGNDIIEGNGGDDFSLGGEGNDIITDLDGADVLKGGPGNDALDSGTGNDIVLGGDGQDFMNAGGNDNESFAGPGNDYVIAGAGADTVFGDGGDDWIEGGTGQDLLQGDHGAAFFDDPGEPAPGNDIFIGQPGENDYDAEGGDDIMAQNAAIDRNAGAGGFDWAIHQYDTVPANDDMMINNNLQGLPIQLVVNRDRWQETEADSGGSLNDVMKGTDGVLATSRLITGGGFTGCDALDQAGVARIKGLGALLPAASTWLGTAAETTGLSASKRCPLVGKVWGEGDILLGGGRSDSMMGRAGDEILDGDRFLQVAITVRNAAGQEIGRTDLMENTATSGNFGPGTAGMTLQAAVFAGLVDPGNLVNVREIVTPTVPAADCAAADPLNCDTAVYAGLQADYTIGHTPDGALTVSSAAEGTDTLRNIERLQFLAEPATSQMKPVRTVAIPNIGTATSLGNTTAGGVTTASARVTFTPGTATGGALTATSFQAVAFDAAGGAVGTSAATTGSPATVTGLPLGGPYTFAVIGLATVPASPTAPATTWSSPASAQSNALTFTAAPQAPTGLTAARGNALATLAWTPGSDNGQPITAYQVEINRVTAPTSTTVAALTVNGAVATANTGTVTGLINNVSYRFRIRAVNATGAGAFSLVSNTVTPAGAVTPPPPPGPVVAGAPNAPAIGRAIQGQSNGIISAFANWAAPAANGTAPITSYEVTALQMGPDNVTVVGTTVFTTTNVTPPLTLEATGLVAGSNYRFTVVAINSAGRSLPSAQSNTALAR